MDFFGNSSNKIASNSLPKLVLKDKTVLSSEKGLNVKWFHFFCIKLIEILPNQIPQIWRKRFPSKLWRNIQVSSWQEFFFAKVIKTEGKIVELYQAASSWKFLKHNTWTRLDSLIPHHAFTLMYIIGGLGLECPMKVHTVWIPSHLSWWEHIGKYGWDIWLCWRFSPKLIWRGKSALW